MTLIVGGIAIWVVLLTLIVGCLLCNKRRKKRKIAAEGDGKNETYNGVNTQIQITNERNQSFPHNPHNPPHLPIRYKKNSDDSDNNYYHNKLGHNMHTIPSKSSVSQSVPRPISVSASRSGNPTFRRDHSGGNNSPNSRNSRYSNYSHVSNRLAIDAHRFKPGNPNNSISRNNSMPRTNSMPRNNSLPRRRPRLDTDQSFDQIYEKVPTHRSATGASVNTNPMFLDVNSRHSEEGMSSDDNDCYTPKQIQPGMSLKEEDEHKKDCEDKVTKGLSPRNINRKGSGGRVARLAMAYNINSNNLPNRSVGLKNVDSIDSLPNLPDP